MLFLYCDGAIEPKNPGGHAVGGWVLKRESIVIGKGAGSYGNAPDVTNNVAEYGAVITGLEQLIGRGYATEEVTIRSDSQLVIRQLTNQYVCRHDVLRKMRDRVFLLLEQFEREVIFEWIPREANTEADAASRLLYGLDTPVKQIVEWHEERKWEKESE